MATATIKTLAPLTVTSSPVRVFPTGASYPMVTRVKIVSQVGNTGVIYVGDSSIDQSAKRGDVILTAGASVVIDASGNRAGGLASLNINEIYATSTVATDKISVTYYSMA